MKTLFLAWQAPDNRAWFPVGRLDTDQGVVARYRFRYTHGALRAEREVSFTPLLAFPVFQKIYESDTLFPLFQNRVLSPKRTDFSEYIRWLDLDEGNADPISILAVSGGERMTDNFEVFPKVMADENGNFKVRFLLHGLRHLSPTAMERTKKLRVGDLLRVAIERNNPATRLAVSLFSEDDVKVGWVPRYLVEDLIKCVPNAPEISAKVAHVNEDAPLSQRILIDYTGHTASGNEPMSTHDFQPLFN